MPIPRIIHQIWFDWGKPEPDAKYQEFTQRWHQMHPDWTMHRWSTESGRDYVEKRFPEYLNVYDTLEFNIQRTDFLRLLLLLGDGGFYVDIDIEPRHSIEPLLEHDVVLAGTPRGGITNFFMGSEPGHPLVRAMVEDVKRTHPFPKKGFGAISQDYRVMASAGPWMVRRVYHKNRHLFTERSLLLKPWQVALTDRYGTPLIGVKPNSPLQYVNHTKASSWCSHNDFEREPWLFLMAPVSAATVSLLAIIITAIVWRFSKSALPPLPSKQTLLAYTMGFLWVPVLAGAVLFLIGAQGSVTTKQRYDLWFAASVLGTLALFIPFTIWVVGVGLAPLRSRGA